MNSQWTVQALLQPMCVDTVNVLKTEGQAKVGGTVVCISGAILMVLFKGPTLLGYANNAPGQHHQKIAAAQPEFDGWMFSGLATLGIDNWHLGVLCLIANCICMAAFLSIQVCWFSGCYSSDILAGLDMAIRDGFDILSLSLGGFPLPPYDDSIAVGSFRAMEHKISVICAAGDNGPIANSVANVAPWVATVGASTLDRRFPTVVYIGKRVDPKKEYK